MLKTLFGKNTSGDSEWIAGIIAVVVMIGMRYIDLRLTNGQKLFLKGSFIREIFIFSVVWLKTRRIFTSVVITAAFMILAEHLFNENSPICLLPERYIQLSRLIDTDKDGTITDEELKKAEDILRKAGARQKKLAYLGEQ